MGCVEPAAAVRAGRGNRQGTFRRWRVAEYSLELTLDCGQAFGWTPVAGGWEAVIMGRWVRLERRGAWLEARLAEPVAGWDWLESYLRLGDDLAAVRRALPAEDRALQTALASCRGLHLLRQEPWECLAAFILSANKQIGQIRRMVATLSQRFGEPVAGPLREREGGWRAFPSPERLAARSEAELRACGLGFRAPRLLAVARAVAEGRFDPWRLPELSLGEARERLLALPGVGPKVADCVLLFAGGFDEVFPLDVWTLRVLREAYFGGKRVPLRRLAAFAAGHFGAHAGYAQQ
ncbi:MAG: hypothetical protein D6766_10665, partial [Verrucomicrobia bacterium]